MKITTKRYWVRLEREKSGSWLEAVVNVPLPRASHPQYQKKFLEMLNSLVLAFWPGWELVTYMEKTDHDVLVERERELENLQ